MQTCFVIQPFDGGQRYDKRYRDLMKPAIENAGLDPYRVDEDPATNAVIDEIERRIGESAACLAEITTDNPNVWFELGYAFALNKIVVMVCSDERRGAFPFDVQHRSIIKYSTDSPSDFATAQAKITAQLKAKIQKRKHLDLVAPSTPISHVKGLKQHDIAALITIAEEIDSTIGIHHFYNDMTRAGFTKLEATLARKVLTDEGMLEAFQEQSGFDEAYTTLRVTAQGLDWLLENQHQFTHRPEVPVANTSMGEADDDLPF